MMNKIDLKKNKESIRFLIIIFFFVGGYAFFLTSMKWMPTTEDASYISKLGIENKWNDRTVVINRWDYSKEQNLMEVELKINNKSYDGKNKYNFSAKDLNGNDLKTNVKVEEDDWIVLQISDVPGRWSDISLRMSIKDSKEETLKLYTNIKDVDKVDKIEKLDYKGYITKRFNIEINNYKDEISKNEKEKIKLNKEIGEIQKEIERLEQKKIYQTEQEKQDSDSLIGEANYSISTKQKKIEDLDMDIAELNERIQMKEQQKQDSLAQ